MAAKIVVISKKFVWEPIDVERLWFLPNGSEFLRYSPHWHLWFKGGFRQNVPMTYYGNAMFVVVMEGRFSIKNYYGGTVHKIEVEDHTWYDRSIARAPARSWYSKMVRGALNLGSELPRGMSRT
jgi:hypothetical protein